MGKKLKIANIGDWEHRGGHLWVCGYSQADMVKLLNLAYRKAHGWEDREDIQAFSISHFRTYGSMGCWGNSMDQVTPERGVWWAKRIEGGWHGKPERII